MSLENFSLACEGVVTIPLLSLFFQISQISHCVGDGKAHPETAQFTDCELDPICQQEKGWGRKFQQNHKQQMSEESEWPQDCLLEGTRCNCVTHVEQLIPMPRPNSGLRAYNW